MYNEERKLQYLAEKQKRAVVSNNIRDEFQLAEKFEIAQGKDMCEWDSSVIIDFYRYHATPFVQSLIQINNSLEGYTTWCIANGLVKDNQNHYSEIGSVALCDCIDFEKFSKMVFSREQLLEDIKELPNVVDQFIILGLFEGIPYTDSTLYNVKIEDIDFERRVVRLPKGKEITISRELMSLAERANDEDVYITMGTGKEFNIAPGDTIIRPIRFYRKKTAENPYSIVGGRFRRSREYLDWPEVSVTTIKESGRLDFFKRKLEIEGGSIEGIVRLHKEESEFIYGKIQNLKTWVLTYGRCLK